MTPEEWAEQVVKTERSPLSLDKSRFRMDWPEAWLDSMAKRIASAIREAIAEEREACAKLVIETSIDGGSGKLPIREVRLVLASAIRARKDGA